MTDRPVHVLLLSMITAFCFRDHVAGEWLRTRFADRVFLAAAIGAILFILEFLTLRATRGITSPIPAPLAWATIAFTAYTSVSWMAIYIGMIYYWLIHDRRRNWWALGVGSFSLFSVFYYFLVYRSDVDSHIGNSALTGAAQLP